MPQSEVVVAARADNRLGSDLESLASTLEVLDIGPGAADLAGERDRLVAAIRTYLMPRLDDPTRPLTVVFAGPTGSGKSTLINSLTGLDLTEAGVIRPTTGEPVALVSGAHAATFATVGGIGCEVVVGTAPILDSMVLIDTPDIDSTATGHRVVAEALIDSADVVVFVTSALRYSDDVAWQVLRRARSRGVDVIHVLNRVGGEIAGAVVDYGARLRSAGFEHDLITIPEHHLALGGQRVPSLAVRSLARRLAATAVSRDDSASSVVDRVLGVLLRQATELLDDAARRSDDADSIAAEVAVTLAARAARLDLAVAAPQRLEAPTRRWRRRIRQSEETTARIERRLIDQIGAIVHADLRTWAAETGASPDVDMLDLSRRAMIKAEAWVRFVSRISSAGARPRLLEVELLRAALVEGPSSLTHVPASEDGEDLLARARRDLDTGIGVVYDEAARMASTAHRERLGALDVTDARAALGVVVARSPLVHA